MLWHLVISLSLCVVRFFADTLTRDFDLLLFLRLVVWWFGWQGKVVFNFDPGQCNIKNNLRHLLMLGGWRSWGLGTQGKTQSSFSAEHNLIIGCWALLEFFFWRDTWLNTAHKFETVGANHEGQWYEVSSLISNKKQIQTPHSKNIARTTTDPGYWVLNLNDLFQLKCFQIDLSQKHDSSYRLTTLGPLCLWQCFFQLFLNFFSTWPPDGTTCISCRFNQQLALLELVTSLAYKWCHLY